MKKVFVKKLIVLLAIVILIMANLTNAYADSPLYSFEYSGKHIETYASYSVIDGEKCTTHRYFVKSGNLVIIDQSLSPKANDIFIHFEDGKSYIAVVRKNGTLFSLGTENVTTYLVDFRNSNIKGLAENITNDSKTMFFTYDDGYQVGYNCVTGEKLFESQTKTNTSSSTTEESESIFSYAVKYFTDFFDNNDSSEYGTNAGARAQGIINTLESSNMTLDTLIESGVLDGIIEDQENGTGEADYQDYYNYDSYLSDEQLVDNNSAVDSIEVPYQDDEEYIEFVNSNELSDESIEVLNDICYEVASGEIDTEEAIEKIESIVLSEDSVSVHFDKEKKDNSSNEDSSLQNDERTLSSQEKENLTKVFNSIEEEYKTVNSDSDAKGNGGNKNYIKSDATNKYVAVYNADEKMYEIYSESDVLENPNCYEDESIGLTSEKFGSLEKLLSDEEKNDTSRGVKLFIIIIVLVAFVIGIMFKLSKSKK